ncbi:MAG: bifunctional 4-hydroxy-2-oxoglutarate aldolase/2-dehydro-3-deoxy-phosphogluconate aldolase [Rubrivivax sp.]
MPDDALLDPLSLADAGPVIPVIVIERVADAVPLARALVAGGVRVLELTLRTPVALEAMRAIVAEVPEAIVGAGTLRTPADVEAARRAGCRFGVSPGFRLALGRACRELGLPLLPGVASASEVMAANDDGWRFLKLFPAAAAGGIALLKSFAGPFPEVVFCPTGGLTPHNAPDYLALPNVVVCGGSWLTPADALAAGDWPRITRLAQAAAALPRRHR